MVHLLRIIRLMLGWANSGLLIHRQGVRFIGDPPILIYRGVIAMRYITKYSFHDGCVDHITKRKQWIVDNGLQSEIDIIPEISKAFTGTSQPFTVFAIKTKEAVMAYRLTWD